MFVQVLQNKELFVHLLSKKERTVLVQAFAYLAHLDNTLHQTELDLISTIAHNLGLDPQIIVADVGRLDLADILQPIDNTQSKRILLQELINLAYADGNYSQEERIGIQKAADILGIEPPVLTKIEKWVEKGRAWAQEGVEIILEGK
jgi:uncharacterized tellurite resistance protein B-like protein